MNEINILELFGGIGALTKAFKRLGIPHKVIDYVEIDKYAVASYNAMNGTNFEPQDICKWDKDIEVDLIMHGSPCQDFSLAGKQAGGDKNSGTRSSLMYETIRIVEKLKPKYVIWENVKNLLSKKHRHNFDAYLETMEQLGYTSYYQVLNAKDYGIPQNRERVFTVSILGNENYEFPKENMQECEVINPLKDISGKSWQFEQNVYSENSILRSLKAGGGSGNIPKVIEHFEFPPKQELKLKLKDMLEEEVDEKYYLSDKMIKYISATGTANFKNPDCKINLDIARPLTTDQNKRAGTTNYLSDDLPNNYDLNQVVRKYGVFDTEKSKHQAGSVYDENELSPTLDTMQGGWRQPCIEIKEATKRGYKEAYEGDGVNISSRMKYQRGNVQKDMIQTITTSGGNERGVVLNEKPRKDIKELEKYCEYCGNKLERKRFNGRLEDFTVFSNRKYCNRECMKKDYLKIGEHNQNWSNAHATARKINELILHKEVCELCGGDKNLDIHHIDGNWQNNNLDNLMCLCRSCHTRYERNKDKTNLRIRKLTPLEVWRLMGFDDSDFDKASQVNSNTQLYKQAGNSIVVNVLEAILTNLLLEPVTTNQETIEGQTTIFDYIGDSNE